MALARAWAVALTGVTGHLIAVEADLAAGLPGTTVIGMGDAAVTQARDRIRAAVVNSGQKWPDRRITLALSPAALPKRGAGYDIALAVAVLAAAGVVPPRAAGGTVFIGELGLDGQVRPVRGVLPALLAARAAGRERAIVPVGNLSEAALATGMSVWGVRNLRDLIGSLKGEVQELVPGVAPVRVGGVSGPDLTDVLGQPEARLALEIAAAGGHHLAMIGPPGAGKTMLASRLPGILPPLDDEQALEVTAVHSVAGTLDDDVPLVTRPPFVNPHHSASLAAIVGGGSAQIRPGSVSLAHRGILHLDEARKQTTPTPGRSLDVGIPTESVAAPELSRCSADEGLRRMTGSLAPETVESVYLTRPAGYRAESLVRSIPYAFLGGQPRVRRAVRSLRLVTPNLPKIFLRWSCTVWGERCSAVAMDWVLAPCSTSSVTSSSRAVRPWAASARRLRAVRGVASTVTTVSL